MTKALLIVTALAETGIGVLLLLAPRLVARLLLGTGLDGDADGIVGRIGGAALLSLGVACWLARDDRSSRALRGLVSAMLLYNTAAIAVLFYAGSGLGLAGMLLWPATLLHAGLAAWCLACVRRGPLKAES